MAWGGVRGTRADGNSIQLSDEMLLELMGLALTRCLAVVYRWRNVGAGDSGLLSIGPQCVARRGQNPALRNNWVISAQIGSASSFDISWS
ncbi:MAG: hypothetical protein ABI583_12445, partial [Betaproteobacteria bacterium]